TRPGGIELATSMAFSETFFPSSLPSNPPIWTFFTPMAMSSAAPTTSTSTGSGAIRYLRMNAQTFASAEGVSGSSGGGVGGVDGCVMSMITGVGYWLSTMLVPQEIDGGSEGGGADGGPGMSEPGNSTPLLANARFTIL